MRSTPKRFQDICELAELPPQARQTLAQHIWGGEPSPGGNPSEAELKLLRDCVEYLDEQGDDASRPRRAWFVMAERLIDALDRWSSLRNHAQNKHLATFYGLGAHALAQPPFCNSRAVISWSQKHKRAHPGVHDALLRHIDPARVSEHAEVIIAGLQDTLEDDSSAVLPGEVRAGILVWDEAPEVAAKLLDELGQELPDEDARLTHELLLARDLSDPTVARAISRLWAASSWMTQRILLKTLDSADHAPLLPELVELGKTATSPATQRVALDACARIGHVAAEPLVLEMLDSPIRALRLAAARAAAAVATRRSIARLHELVEDETIQLKATAMEAIEAIEERYPASKFATRGGLTLAEGDSIRGALSVAVGDDGALSLYDEVERALEREPAAPSSSTETSLATRASDAVMPAWYALQPAPRKVPLGGVLELHTIHSLPAAISVIAMMMVGTFIWIPEGMLIPHTWIGLMVAFISFTLGHSKARMHARALRDGIPTMAEFREMRQYKNGNDNVVYEYTFEYMTEEGELATSKRTFRTRRTRFEDAKPDPMLYLPGEGDAEIVLLDEFQAIHVDKTGKLNTRKLVMFFITLYILAGAAGIASVIARIASAILF